MMMLRRQASERFGAEACTARAGNLKYHHTASIQSAKDKSFCSINKTLSC